MGYSKALGKAFEFPAPVLPKLTLRDAIGDLASEPLGEKAKAKNHEFSEAGFSPIFLSRNRVRGWDECSFTILATDRHIPFHPQAPKMAKKAGSDIFEMPAGKESLYRRLTIRECARIQGFPDSYEFVYSKKRIGYKMIGNAVPVNLAYWIAKTIMQDLRAAGLPK